MLIPDEKPFLTGISVEGAFLSSQANFCSLRNVNLICMLTRTSRYRQLLLLSVQHAHSTTIPIITRQINGGKHPLPTHEKDLPQRGSPSIPAHLCRLVGLLAFQESSCCAAEL